MNYVLLLTILFIGVAIIIVLSKYRYDEMTKLSFWSSRNKDRHFELIQMLDVMKDKFDRVNIEWYLIAGGLLGAVRNNKLIPWDDDLDIGIRYNTESDRKRYIKLILSLYEDDENVIVTEETIINPLKILNKNNGVFIDIFFYTNISDDIIHSSNSKDRQVFAPCHFYDSSTGEMSPYDIMNFDKLPYLSLTSNDIKTKINQLVKEAVKIRCETTERPFGCFLSGGLDSSLVAAIVSKHVPGKLKTFSVGLQNATDLLAAKQVADYIGSDHHELILTESEMLDAIPGVIQQIESYDVTTVRASTPMVLLSRWIKQNTDVTVLFSGEGADELSGSYRYFDKSPNPLETQRECTRLLNDLHLFDVLRCDKSVSGCGLEPRVPFLDFNFVNFYMRIDRSQYNTD